MDKKAFKAILFYKQANTTYFSPQEQTKSQFANFKVNEVFQNISILPSPKSVLSITSPPPQYSNAVLLRAWIFSGTAQYKSHKELSTLETKTRDGARQNGKHCLLSFIVF